MRLISWNVNGIRAAHRKGFLDWLLAEKPDVMCVQETKALPEQLGQELREPEGYHAYFNSAERKGYSGVATFCRKEPASVVCGMGEKRFDSEGRMVVTEHPGFFLCNVYFPNGKKDRERLDYKMAFYRKFLKFANGLRETGKGVVVTGDFNTAHNEIDLARPKENSDVSGFLPIERRWMDTLVDNGYVDTFRHLNPDLRDRYSWWDMKTRARERNVGWRLDYFFISDDMVPRLKDAVILDDVMGSDHCPVGIELKDVKGG